VSHQVLFVKLPALFPVYFCFFLNMSGNAAEDRPVESCAWDSGHNEACNDPQVYFSVATMHFIHAYPFHDRITNEEEVRIDQS
jgi:hypothetical protein